MILKNKSFGQYLKRLREDKGLKQHMLASLLNVTSAAISSWEVGKTIPTSNNLAQLAKLYGDENNELLKDFMKFQKMSQQVQVEKEEMETPTPAIQSAKIKNNGMVQKTFLLPADLNKFLESIAAEEDISFGTLVRNILRQYEADYCRTGAQQ